MPIVAADWTYTRSTGVFDYIGSDHGGSPLPTYATVIEFYRWFKGLADDSEYTGDDQIDITSLNPGTRQTDNIIELKGGNSITATALEHLYDGSIIWSDGDEIWDGIVNYGNADVQIQIHRNGAVLADDWWNQAGAGLNADATQGISHRFMIQTRTGGVDIDGRRLLGTNRRYLYTYGEFLINGTARGNNVLALSDSLDLNNETAAATVATWTTITNVTEGYVLLDVNNDGTDESYYSEWDRDTYTINQYYERRKWLERDGAADDSPHIQLYGLDPELFRGITHEIDIDNVINTFPAFGSVSWATGTGQMLAIKSESPQDKMWIQLLTGVAPTDGQTITCTSASPQATADVNVTVTDRSSLISTPSVGQSTGTALIGAYGQSLQTADLSTTDKVFDLTNTQITPPNNVTFTQGGLVAAESYVFIGPWDGTSTDLDGNPEVNEDQYRLATSLTGVETQVVTTAAIDTDTPASGTIRVETDSGKYKKVNYSSFTGSTFTITVESPTTGDFTSDNATVGSPSKNIYITYLDQLATGSPEGSIVSEQFNYVYSIPNGDRDFVIKVRDGGSTPLKEYIATGSMGDTGGSNTAIRTSDS